MKQNCLVIILLAILPCLTLAETPVPPSEPAACEQPLSVEVEFSKEPNDKRSGLITDQLELSVENLVEAYRRGIFPWSVNEQNKASWHSPPMRGILDFANVLIGNSDMKFIQRNLNSDKFEVTFDKAFDQVIQECAEMKRYEFDAEKGHKVESGAWMSVPIVEAYKQLHRAGYAHSVEVWHKGELVGGMYGVYVDGFFAGESMFHKMNNAVKLPMYLLIERLKANGHTFMDTQQTLGLVKKWNGEQISREEFNARLRQSQDPNRPF